MEHRQMRMDASTGRRIGRSTISWSRLSRSRLQPTVLCAVHRCLLRSINHAIRLTARQCEPFWMKWQADESPYTWTVGRYARFRDWLAFHLASPGHDYIDCTDMFRAGQSAEC